MDHESGQVDEAQLERLRAKLRVAEDGYGCALLPVLRELAPSSSSEEIERAVVEVSQAISAYRSGLDSAPRESLQVVREELRQKKAALEACLSAVEGEAHSLMANGAFWMEFLRTPGSRRDLRKHLSCAIRAVDGAVASFAGAAPHQGDSQTPLLAAKLALTMRRLGLKLRATSDINTKSGGSPKSAGLARLLRTSMELAGESPVDDLRYFIKKGFELARAEGVPVLVPFDFNGDKVQLLSEEKFDSK